MRNPPQAMAIPAPTPVQQAVHIQGQEPLTASMLAAAPPQEQKQMLGERLFPLIQCMYPQLTGKIDHRDVVGNRQLRAPAHVGA